MPLLDLLGIGDPAEIDPTRELSLCGLTLGAEAAREAVNLMSGGTAPAQVELVEREVEESFSYLVSRGPEPIGEVFGFPSGTIQGLPTAIEIGLVRALHVCPQDMVDPICGGNKLVAIGNLEELRRFLKVAKILRKPLVGQSFIWKKYSRLNLTSHKDSQLTDIAVTCFDGSLASSPLKFRFLELYRIIEARFLREVLDKLNQNFSAGPTQALEHALESLKSELAQMARLAEGEKAFFEMIWGKVDALRGTNGLAAALFKKLNKRNDFKSPEWRAGAAIVYFLRCAIVHAGEKDIMFESYADGEFVVESIIEEMEEAALALAGITMSYV